MINGGNIYYSIDFGFEENEEYDVDIRIRFQMYVPRMYCYSDVGLRKI